MRSAVSQRVPVPKLTVMLIVLLGVGLSCAGCGSGKDIVIRPLISQETYDGLSCPKGDAKYYVENVIDKRGYGDPANIGFTQTGLFNAKTSVLSDPEPARLVGSSLRQALSHCGQLATMKSEAKYVLKIGLVGFQVTEVTGMFSENITGMTRYEVEVVDIATGEQVGRFYAEGEDTRGGADTTEFADDVSNAALTKSIEMTLEQLGNYR